MRRPSSTPARTLCDAAAARRRRGSARPPREIRRTSRNERRKVAESIAKPATPDPNVPKITPAIPAPTTPPMTWEACASELATGNADCRDDVRQHRATGGTEEGRDRRLREAQDVEERHQDRALHETEREDDAGSQQVGGEHDPATVPAVDVDARDGADRERGDRLGDGHHRQGGGGPGQVVDDEQDEQQRDAVADVGDDLSGEEVAVVADTQDVARAHRRRRTGHRRALPVGRG